jgi:glycosyltransferase involved in cell wall biosynthesis
MLTTQRTIAQIVPGTKKTQAPQHAAMADSTAEDGETPVAENQLRIAVTSVFGDPWHPRTWSGAPYNVARHLARMGHHVEGLHPDLSRIRLAGLAALRWLGGHGLASKSEALQRMSQARIRRARIIAREVDRRSIDRVVHTGTLDLPLATTQDGAQHYLLCDHTWDLSLRHRPDRTNYDLTLLSQFEELERKAYADMRHIFTFAQYVRTNLIEHYGIAPDRVTVVGSGMGNILPFAGPKDYVGGHMLFVAKHLFVEKGGPLVLEGFRRARRKRPDLSLVIVGHEDHRAAAADQEGVVFFGHVPWSTLEALYRSAALLVQPMLNDP